MTTTTTTTRREEDEEAKPVANAVEVHVGIRGKADARMAFAHVPRPTTRDARGRCAMALRLVHEAEMRDTDSFCPLPQNQARKSLSRPDDSRLRAAGGRGGGSRRTEI